MVMSILYIILAILGLSFLVFIHELGHYYMARRLGMRVETFSIGFGKPLYTWERDGVHWQIGWLPFGGYVKIAGMELGEKQDPYQVKDGFFGKKPLDRIKVAFMGPFVNILFALLAFTGLWLLGGREKRFSEYTHKMGWIDRQSELYQKGIRPGDEITAYNDRPYQSTKDHLYNPMTSGNELEIKGYKVNFYTGEKVPFAYLVKTYSHPQALDKDLLTAGILEPASYLVYNKINHQQDNPLPEGSPMYGSGIEYGDRIVWMDGELVYSAPQLSSILNDGRAFLTIRRGQDILFRRVPRVKAEELKLDTEFREELIDWQFEAQLNGVKIQKLYTLPYNLTNEGVVEAPVRFIDKEKEEDAFPKYPYSTLEMPLEPGDRIVAVDGIPVIYSYQILSALQERHVNMIVQKGFDRVQLPSWQQADEVFDQQIQIQDLQKLIGQIGVSQNPIREQNNLYLLKPVVPKMRNEFTLSPESQAYWVTESQAQRKEIENIDDPEKRAQALHRFETRDRQLLLGVPLQDQKVSYNPDPIQLFGDVFSEIASTLKALFTGSLNPKWMSGPIGIVQVVHDNSMISLKEALFWLGAISLNLGVLNLLPLPVLDGGAICFALFELVTGRRLKSKTIERLIIPFAILIIAFFIYLTYNDLSRIFGGFF